VIKKLLGMTGPTDVGDVFDEVKRQAEEDGAAIRDANEHWDKHGQVPACDLWRSLHPAAIARAERREGEQPRAGA
jgi:hypothetical protein